MLLHLLFFSDATGTFTYAFVIMGVIVAVGASVAFLMPWLTKRREQKSESKLSSDTKETIQGNSQTADQNYTN